MKKNVNQYTFAEYLKFLERKNAIDKEQLERLRSHSADRLTMQRHFGEYRKLSTLVERYNIELN